MNKELFNMAQLIGEVGRLHMETLALRSECELLMRELATMAEESERKGDFRDTSDPIGDQSPRGTDGLG